MDYESEDSKKCLELWIQTNNYGDFQEVLEYLIDYLNSNPHPRFFWENDKNKVFGRITDNSVPLDKVIKDYGF